MTENDDSTLPPSGLPADPHAAGGLGARVGDDGATEELLRRADPARSLAPLDPRQMARLMETTMNRAAAERTPGTRASAAASPTPASAAPPPARRRLGWVLAAAGAAAVVLAVVSVSIAVQGAGSPQVTELAAGPGNGAEIAMKCAEITPDMLAGSADVAFEATVTGIADDGTVTLAVTKRYAGEVTDVVEVPQGDDAPLDGMPLHYDEAGDYLIAASDGAILTCGQSGPATPELEQLYATAFGG